MVRQIARALSFYLIFFLYFYPNIRIDDELKFYVYSFASQCNMKVGDFNHVLLVDKIEEDESAVGICLLSKIQSHIKIKRSYWNAVGDTQKMALIGHEMIHCKYGTLDIYDSNQIGDLMYYMIPTNEESIEVNWNLNIRKYCEENISGTTILN